MSNSLFFPYDVYSRHKIISELLGNNQTILDVGGSLKELENFLPLNVKLFATDIIGGDVTYNGEKLPFKDNSVDSVVSIDTIEHIPKTKRPPFINELARVARKQLIIAAPLGTTAHIKAEKTQLHKQDQFGKNPDKYLSEHVKHGLPQLSEIKHWLVRLPNHKLIFSGDFRVAQILFQLHRSETNIPKVGRAWFELKKLIFAIINLSLFAIEKEVPLSENVNRFYLSIHLK